MTKKVWDIIFISIGILSLLGVIFAPNFSHKTKTELSTPTSRQTQETQSPNQTEATEQDVEVSSNSQEPAYDLVNVTLEVDGISEQLSVPAGSTVYDVMQISSHALSTQDFGEMGMFIKSIDGKEGSVETGYFWILYINGEKATQGASFIVVEPGQVISWKYEEDTN